jgi:hypothetical protein
MSQDGKYANAVPGRGWRSVALASFSAATLGAAFLLLPSAQAAPTDKITICHATGSTTNPYVAQTVSIEAVKGHAGHGDIIPAYVDREGVSFPGQGDQAILAAGCATTSPAPVTTSPAPVTTSPAPVTTSPAPVTTSPAPVTTSPAPGNMKVTICHATGSTTNPYVAIEVSASAVLNGHGSHDGDIIPPFTNEQTGFSFAGANWTSANEAIYVAGCSVPGVVTTSPEPVTTSPAPVTTSPAPGNMKVTICHATGSTTNPYVAIEVSASAALNGHGSHDGDIIPPFTNEQTGFSFAGANWTSANEAIYVAGCSVPGVVTTSPEPVTTSPAPVTTSPAPGNMKVTICHATGSTTNPYVAIEVSASAVLNGHGSHEGDIIPPFTNQGMTFLGLNWNAQGQAIWEAGCVVPAPVTTTPAPVTTTPAPVTTSPAPVTTSPAPVTTSPAPVTTTPAPVTTTPAPVTTTPAPVFTPAPVTTTPAPVFTPGPGNTGPGFMPAPGVVGGGGGGFYPQAVDAGSGPLDPGSSRPLWLWMVPFALLALAIGAMRQSLVEQRR